MEVRATGGVTRLLAAAIALTTVFIAPRLAAQEQKRNLCDVVASAAEYDEHPLTLEGILISSFHSVDLYSPSCPPHEGFDVSIEAIFAGDLKYLPNGRKVSKLLRHGGKARVTLNGTFHIKKERYSMGGERFSFVITKIASVHEP